MFNYWTEGGAIAFGQKPDPKTGEIPLKLFMDGRAQAAYNHDKYVLWQYIYYGLGCPTIQKARRAERALSEVEYREAGEWFNNQLQSYQVWVVLVPGKEANSELIRALRVSGSWKTAYFDPYQTMLVNVKTEQGRRLIDDILSDRAVFPNAVSRGMTLCRLIPEQAFSLSLAEKIWQSGTEAFRLRPSPLTFLELVNVSAMIGRSAMMVQQADAYLADFEINGEIYRRQDGYADRLYAAWKAANYLAQSQPGRKAEMAQKVERFKAEENTFSGYSLW
jgi:hypothetical protein